LETAFEIYTTVSTKMAIADVLVGVFKKKPIVVVYQRAIVSARMSSRAFLSLGTKEHENGFAQLERTNINLGKTLEKNSIATLREYP